MSCSELEKIFKSMDKNGDGFVTGAELVAYMQSCDSYKSLSAEKLKEASQKVMGIADKNNDGKISKQEFMAINQDLLKQLK